MLRETIASFRNNLDGIRDSLRKKPLEWGKYQSVFNYEVNGLFRKIMDFERECVLGGKEERIYKLKRFFINKLRNDVVCGDYIAWSLKKPFGYAGDFQIIEDIYDNAPKTLGYERLFDNYFMMSAISVAVRNRKNDFKKYLAEFLSERKNESVRILDLGSGPAREVVELFQPIPQYSTKELFIDFLDNDSRALNYLKTKLQGCVPSTFLKENVVRLALKKDVTAVLPRKYDFIYSTGLFDYFDDRLTRRLLCNLKEALKPGGYIVISDVRDKYSNPSVHFMEWVGDWNLYYRDDEVFRDLFCEAGFKKESMSIGFEQQGILQYIKAQRT